jgi:hypothetical protein
MHASMWIGAAVGAVASACTQFEPPPCSFGSAQTVQLDERTPEGDTALGLVARAAGPRSGTMQWKESHFSSSTLQTTPPPSVSTIDIAVTSTATEASYRPAWAREPNSRIACFGLLSVAAAARVVTGDGGLDEQWTISLDNNARPDGAGFVVDLREQPVQGSFRLVDPDASSWDETSLRFGADFTPDGAATGSVSYGASRVRGNEHSGYVTSVATWTVAPR